MATYRVEYRIDIEADSREEAAQIAQFHCVEPSWHSRIWTVMSEDGEERDIELDAKTGDVVSDNATTAN